MIEIIGYLIGGAIVGGSLTFGLMNGTKQAPVPIIVSQDEVAKELGKLDVVSPICSPDFIEKQGDGLCRELMCMTQTNSATGEVSGTTCDNITNLRNKKNIISFCSSKEETEEEKIKCVELFQRRGI
jgi:hypothetical protein|tara:strand:+ start:231 stop:611 length:381 start_codon:yes stop_codon:yes gene_type:complete